MCGIVGAIGLRSRLDSHQTASILGALKHRGPDDCGAWFDDSGASMLGQTRLSIVDLSEAGHQPMHSPSGRFVLVFNGEIYNHAELRAALGNLQWRGHSDTETLLAWLERRGVQATLQAAVGMFAFALWDRERRTLTLARDRFGEKPLYYGYVGGAFAFASELKAIRALPGFQGEIDRDAVALFLRYNVIPAEHCVYRGLAKLRPGTWIEVSGEMVARQEMPACRVYWSAVDAARRGIAEPWVPESDEAAIDAVEGALATSIAGQMVADVPVGAFLSGGIDSSTIVALMQRQSPRPVRTFSIGFSESGYDEAQAAKAVAAHLGTDHTELYVTPRDAMALIPRLPAIYDEPFADSSQIPTYLVAAMARRDVTVSLSGDAGDELFGGYTRYAMAARTWRRLERLPMLVRRGAASGIRALSPGQWQRLASALPARYSVPLIGDKLHKAAGVLDSESGQTLYRRLVSHWSPDIVMRDAREPTTSEQAWPALSSLVEEMMALDAVTYLPDDILVKVDRAAMAVSLETRIPMLDHRVFELAWRLPMHYKIRGRESKWVIRQVLYRYVPRSLIDRPKMGFGVPIGDWLRGPLRDWAEALLDTKRLDAEGFFRPDAVRQKWSEHLSGVRNWQYHLWDVLMFQAWLDEQRNPLSAESF